MTDCSSERDAHGDASDSERIAAAPATEDGSTDDLDADATNLDVDEAVERIRARADVVRERELDTAIARLEGQGELSGTEREAVEELADRLVARLLAVPEASLREAAASDDDETVETAAALFGRGQSSEK